MDSSAANGTKRSIPAGLPSGWVKEEVQRQKGIYAGKYDTYYIRFAKTVLHVMIKKYNLRGRGSRVYNTT